MHDLAPAGPACGWTDTEVSVTLRRGAGGAVRVDGVLCQAPVWARWDGSTLWLVGSGAAPVGGDRVRVHVDVGPGVAVTVRSVAATVVYAARGEGTRWDTDVRVGEGASLRWRPEPVILTERARHAATTTVRAARDALVVLDEVVVLGRDGEAGGALRSSLAVDLDEVPVLRTSIDTTVPGWSGPAGVAGATVVGHRLRLDRGGEGAADTHTSPGDVTGGALLEPAPGCRLAVAVATQVAGIGRRLDALLPDGSPDGIPRSLNDR